MRIDWTSGPTPGIAGRGRRKPTGFSVADAAEPAAPSPQEVGPNAAVLPLDLDAIAPPAPETGRSDREAALHGQAVLDALGDVQLAALGGDGGQAMGRLADLGARSHMAADPALNDVLQAVAARAAVELARPR